MIDLVTVKAAFLWGYARGSGGGLSAGEEEWSVYARALSALPTEEGGALQPEDRASVPICAEATPEIGWLIEKEDGGLFFRMATRWTRDASEALRFCRESDARDFAEAFEGGQYVSVLAAPIRITEHRWG